jgi:serine/threonine protein kinase
MLDGGEMVAIKRAKQTSMGGSEFKNEVELLSRVHHKNLVGLVGFCFEQEEQMLVYEFIPNGNLGESLSGKNIPFSCHMNSALAPYILIETIYFPLDLTKIEKQVKRIFDWTGEKEFV